jgi:glycosyltransferase involved in cell wall biosynthesis
MKVALVHDWLTGMRGGERCLEAFLCLYPKADIFTLVHVPGATSPQIDARVRATSILGKIPGIAKRYRSCLPLYPLAAASLNLSGYDLVISLSHAAAKNVKVPAGVPHVCYCFTPMRYVWDQAPQYFRGVSRYVAQPLLRLLRAWDVRGAARVTHFVAISSFVAARIRRFYRRNAEIISPPVRLPHEMAPTLSLAEASFFRDHPESFFLCAGALVPYKRIEVAVQAFSMLNLPLWVLGSGSELERLEAQAGPTVRFLGQVSDPFLWECYRRCRALVFPGIEDFGIVPVECMASGRPVIGVDAGGLRDSVVGLRPWIRSNLVSKDECGVFIPKKGYGDPKALAEAVLIFCHEEHRFDPAAARRQAAHFSYANFFQSWEAFADRVGIYPGVGPASSQGPIKAEQLVPEREVSC